MSSGRFAEVRTPLILSILMVLMTQVGYLDLMNAWSGDEETLDQTSNMPDERDASLSSGSSATNILNGYQLSAKGLHSCSILDNGSLMCWGLNNRGQIGIGTTTNAHTPQWVDLGSGTNVTQVANGYRHTCAMLENGSLMCWGENSDGQLGNGQTYSTQTTPLWVDLGAGRTATRIDAGSENTCAIVDNGSLYCWGENSNGMLNENPSLLSRQTTPRWIDLGGHTPSSISVGNMNVCTILNNGSLYCWGNDDYGQLARGSVTGSESWDPLYVDFGTGVTVAQISLGNQHLCAIVDNGSLYCWGRNDFGQLGNGSGGSSNPSTGTPSWVDLGTGRTAVSVSAGDAITCAIVDNGSLYCWGANNFGQVGIGTTGGTPYTPQWVDLGVGRTAVAVSTGTSHTCATLDNGSISCWGSDYSGALGNGAGASDSSSPGIISGGFNWSTSNGSNSGSSSSNYALTPSVEGADLSIDVPMTNITFQYNASAASGSGSGSGGGSGSGSSQSSFVNNIGLRTTSGSATQSANGTAITPIEFSLEWDNFSLPSSLSSSETAIFPFDHSVNDTTSTPVENSTLSASNLTYDRHGREMHALDESVVYDANTTELQMSSNRISLSLWIKPTNVGTEQSIIDNHPQYHLRMDTDGSLNFRNRQNHFSGAWNNHYSSTQLEDDTWYHIGVSATYSSNTYTVNFYVNGSLDVQRTSSSGGSFTSSTTSQLDLMGPSGNLDGFEGILDDLYVYDAVLSASDFSTLMDVGEITWDVSPSLPAGLSLDTFTGTITGTPSTSQGAGQYTVYANSSSTSHSRTFNLLNSGSSMTDVTGASCSISPSLPTGLSIDSSTCTISGTPTVETSNTTYTVTAVISNVTYEGSVWLSTSTFGTITSAVEGAALNLGEAMTPITLNYTVNANTSSGSSGGSGSGGSSSSASSFAYENNKLSAGYNHQCAITDNGELKCWGLNSLGQLGNGGSSTAVAPPSTPIDLGTGRTAVAVSGGRSHTCAILDNGSVKCWGNDQYGQLGNGGTVWGSPASTNQPSSTPIDLGAGRTAVAIDAGGYHTCAVLDNGDLKCWGRNNNGQLGLGFKSTGEGSPSSSPIDLGTGRTAVAVSAGGDHTCAILDNGDLKCWGENYYGQLGAGYYQNDADEPLTAAINLGTGRTAVAVSTGEQHTCAILDNGELKCWGSDGNGRLGDGGSNANTNAPSSNSINLGTGRTAVGVSNGHAFTCAILDNGDLKCWGKNAWGVIGDGSTSDTNAPSSTPIDFGTGRTVVAVSAGEFHACVILDNGTMSCWGGDNNGELGNGGYPNTGARTSPDAVAGNNTWDTTTTTITWETHPALPAGMSISGGTISGTPSVYAKNQTYTIYANQSGYSTTHELYFSVDTNNPHTVVENQAIDPIGFHPPFNNGTTVWSVSPALPGNLSINTSTGEITGSVNGTLANTAYTVTATHNGSATETFSFNLRSLADYDGDGLPNDLPGDYDAAEGPTPGLVADSDDDGDGLDDSVETGTGNYVDGTDTGTNPLNPDTDGDGICDGPNAVPGVCVAGPDADPNGAVPPPTLVGVNNTAISTLSPYLAVSGGTYEISPDLPASLTLDANTGEISGTPTQTLANTTFTVWANHSDGTSLTWDFTIEILEDSDGDGLPNELPGDYDSSNPDSPGLVEDLDDDADGLPDTDEGDTGTSPTNPDTDGDGMCDGINAVPGVCTAGPDAFPLDPSADTDTDGDGMPDTIDGDSTSVPPLVEDEDDDGDGLDDVNETGTGTYVDESDTGTDPLDPDTDNDGICDGPNAVPPICVAGPDETPLGQTAEGTIYALNNSLMVSLTPKYTIPDGTYEIHPALPAGVTIDPVSGIISGTPTEVIPETEYTVYGNATAGGLFFTFNLQVLEDTDRDGLPNELPEDYPEDGELVEDLDDDGDGASDLSETGTGIYNGTGDLGTDSLNPDTDGDGICDGPNAVPPICLAGPDSNPVGTGPLGPTVLVNNTETTPINPPNAVPGATWEVSPDLPEGLVLDPATGIITGTPTRAMDNTTYTIWANTTDPAFSIEATFWLEVLEDFDGDGLPDELPDDYPDTGVEPYTLIEDEDDDNDGLSDTNESIIGTNPFNPDTDGDGFCDGDLGVEGVCYAGPDSHPLDPTLPVNTDGDAYPDEDPDGPGGLIADDDDDNDGYLDTTEVTCESDPLNATSLPDDMDGDGICDLMDDDMDGDGIPNDDELGLPIDTSPSNPDSDGDGVCDGPEAPANGGCVAGPDAFPLDPAGAKDTDGDGKPDQLVPGVTSTSQPPLVEDLDDDDDTWSDADELACGTSSPTDAASVPVDTDGDGICDTLDPYLDLPFTLEYPTQYVDLFVNRTMEPLLPWVNGSGDVVTWELEGELPEGLTFGWSPARDATMDGSIRGTPTNASATVNLTVWANNSFYSESFALSLTVFNDSDNDSLPDQLPEGYVGNLTEDTDDDNDGLSDSQETECGSDPMDPESGTETWLTVCLESGGDGQEEDGPNWMWCFPCLLFLLLLLIIPLLLGRDRLLVMLSDGPEPENTFAEPDFTAGSGTEDDPFILAPVGPLQPGAMESTVEEITITNMGDIKVDMFDFNDEDNYGRFTMYESAFSMEGSRQLPVGKDGEMVINFKFDDREFPTYEGGTYTGRIKLGKASVYFLWEVTVMADERKAENVKKETMSRIKKRKKDFNFDRIGKATKKDADDLQAIKGIGPYSEEKLNALGIFTYEQLANFDRQTEDEVNDAIEHYKGRIRRDEWVKQAQDIIGAQAKADEEALKAAEEAQAKAEAEAKAAEEAEAAAKAAEEAEAAKKAEEEAAAAAAAAAAEKEAKDAEKKAKEADKKAKEEAAAKKKAEAEAKKAKAAEEKAAKEAEKKAKADKKAKEEAAAAAAAKKAEEEAAAAAAAKKAEEEAKKKAEEEAAATAAAAAKPANKEEKKKAELKRVKERSKSIDFKVLGTAKASEKDDLQVIKGIGPFIEEKLNALGIYTYLQISKMTSKLEDQVNEAIEFFPGRVKRDQWVNQAKILLGEDVKLDEKALKQAEELERVAAKAEKIDFATLGVASASEKDDLKAIKGIGPFIEEKLNALGIYTFEQVSKMTAKIEEEVNIAIEFFPGRVKRDEWAKQAKTLHKDKK